MQGVDCRRKQRGLCRSPEFEFGSKQFSAGEIKGSTHLKLGQGGRNKGGLQHFAAPSDPVARKFDRAEKGRLDRPGSLTTFSPQKPYSPDGSRKILKKGFLLFHNCFGLLCRFVRNYIAIGTSNCMTDYEMMQKKKINKK